MSRRLSFSACGDVNLVDFSLSVREHSQAHSVISQPETIQRTLPLLAFFSISSFYIRFFFSAVEDLCSLPIHLILRFTFLQIICKLCLSFCILLFFFFSLIDIQYVLLVHHICQQKHGGEPGG